MLACIAGRGQGHAATSMSVVGWQFMTSAINVREIQEVIEETARMGLNEASVLHSYALSETRTYRVQLQKPIWSGLVKVKEDFLIGKLEFSQCNLHTLRPTTTMVGVELDLWVL